MEAAKLESLSRKNAGVDYDRIVGWMGAIEQLFVLRGNGRVSKTGGSRREPSLFVPWSWGQGSTAIAIKRRTRGCIIHKCAEGQCTPHQDNANGGWAQVFHE